MLHWKRVAFLAKVNSTGSSAGRVMYVQSWHWRRVVPSVRQSVLLNPRCNVPLLPGVFRGQTPSAESPLLNGQKIANSPGAEQRTLLFHL